MPIFEPIKLTLKKICLQFISRKIDYWCYHYVSSFQDEGIVAKHCIGPFDWLNPEFIQELFDNLTQRRVLRPRHFHLMLHSGIKHLRLPWLWYTPGGQVIAEMIALRCMKITDLNLSNCDYLSPDALMQLCQSLPLLSSLDLSWTRTTDQVLTVIGQNCLNLKRLDLAYVGHISDNGILSLTYNPVTGKPGCQLLQVLNIRSIQCVCTCKCHESWKYDQNYNPEPWIKPLTLLSLIRYCKDLRWLECFEMFEIMQMWHIKHDEKLSCKIKNLELYCSKSITENFYFMVTYMPLVEVLYVGLNHCALLLNLAFLKYWKRLKHLTVSLNSGFPCCCHNMSDVVSFFEERLTPLLKIRGHQITCLVLEGIYKVDIVAIGNLCQSLEKLQLEWFSCFEHPDNKEIVSSQVQPSTNPKVFVNLAMFYICSKTASSDYQIKYLLQRAKNLEYLTMDVPNLQYNDIYEVILHMSKLKKLSVSNNHHITKDMINSFLYVASNLQELHIFHCSEITMTDYKAWCEEIKTRNLNIKINYLPC